MEKIGIIIRRHRTAKGMTQEELGKKVFVSKQAVSKWETGKTMPDVEMIRKLCTILDIDRDEVLGGTIEEAKKSRKWIKVCVVIASISMLIALFFGLGGVDYIDRNTQFGVAYLTVFSEGNLLSADEYTVESELDFENQKNGYKSDVGYGEIRGIIHLPEDYEIEYGFVNPNNWHNIQIRIDFDRDNGQFVVKQTISYETDNDVFEVIVTKGTSKTKKVSVFREGI